MFDFVAVEIRKNRAVAEETSRQWPSFRSG
jgi:hypothetical protein